MSNYKKISSNIQELIIDNPKTTQKDLTWINISNCSKKETDFLRKKYNFNTDHLKASRTRTHSQRPDLAHDDHYLFLTIHFPIADKDGNIIPEEINFFVGEDYLITVHRIKNLHKFFDSYKKGEDVHLSYELESADALLCEILEQLVKDCNILLDQNSVDIDRLEDIIFDQKSKKAVSEILDIRRNIINASRILQNHQIIFKKLITFESNANNDESIKERYNELLEGAKDIWESFQLQRELIEVLNSTNESLMNYRLNDIMKTLTIFSVIVFPLTLLAAIFGMNTVEGMPFMHTENGFWMIIGIMLLGSFGMILFFAKKKWF